MVWYLSSSIEINFRHFFHFWHYWPEEMYLIYNVAIIIDNHTSLMGFFSITYLFCYFSSFLLYIFDLNNNQLLLSENTLWITWSRAVLLSRNMAQELLQACRNGSWKPHKSIFAYFQTFLWYCSNVDVIIIPREPLFVNKSLQRHVYTIVASLHLPFCAHVKQPIALRMSRI